MQLTLEMMARALHGKVSGNQVLAPGPNHKDPNDRSMAVKLSNKNSDGFVVHSHAGDDDLKFKDYIRAKLGIPQPEFKKKKTKAQGNGAVPPRRSLDDELGDMLAFRK